MSINFPKKENKTKVLILDLLKLLYWDKYKFDNQKSTDMNTLYKQFTTEWLTNDIHSINDIETLTSKLRDMTKERCQRYIENYSHNDND